MEAIPLSAADREPVDAPVNLDGVVDPQLLAPDPGDASSPVDAVADEIPAPLAGDLQMDVFAPEPGVGDHFALLSSDVFNLQDAEGRWIDASLVADDYGWSLQSPSFTIRFPKTLSSATPLVYEIGGGTLSIVPTGTNEVPATVSGTSVRYDEVLPFTDLQYEVDAQGYKESAILRQRAAPTMPQAAAGYTIYGEGGALAMEQGEHVLTRTYGFRGAQTLKADADLTFRQILAKDIRDVRSIVGSRYNSGLLDLIGYYRTNFPELMAKGGGL